MIDFANFWQHQFRFHIHRALHFFGLGLKQRFIRLRSKSSRPAKNFFAFVSILRPTIALDGPDYHTKVLRPSYLDEIKEPIIKMERRKMQRKRYVWVPPAKIFDLRDASVLFDSQVLTQNGDLFLWDISADPAYGFVAGQAGRVQAHGSVPDKCILSGEVEQNEIIDEAALITGRCSWNYYHWLIEYLPRILLLSDYPTLPLLCPANIPRQSKEALELIAGSRPIIWTSDKTMYRIKKLVIPGMLNYCIDTVVHPLWTKGGLAKDYLTSFREFIFERIGIERSLVERKVFLIRSGRGRGLLNQDEILEVSRAYGFEALDPSELSFADQVKTISSANVVAGASGASFANLLFSASKAKIFAFTSRHTKSWNLFSNLASIVDADYRLVPGSPQFPRPFYKTELDYVHANFFVRPKHWQQALDELNNTQHNICQTNSGR